MKRSLPAPGNPPRLTPKTGRPSKALKGLAVHHCTYKGCGKTYTRKEHLLRHERTHRNELPYVCMVCKQGYARQDLLKRHSTLKHGHVHPGELEPIRSNGVAVTGLSPQTSPNGIDQRTYRFHEQNAQSIMRRSQTSSVPSRQSSSTTQELAAFSEMQISLSTSSPLRQLPVPWGARQLDNKQNDPDIDLLRAASYGNLTEIRRLHLKGVDVLASGRFENGENKSALLAAALAIKTCFEDIQRKWPQLGPGRDAVWRDINAKVESIKYLVFHGASLDKLDPILRENVEKAFQGPPPVSATDERTHISTGYRLIAAAGPDVKLAPMNTSDVKSPSEPLDTIVLCSASPENMEEVKEPEDTGNSPKAPG